MHRLASPSTRVGFVWPPCLLRHRCRKTLGSQCAPPVCLSCVSHGQLVEHIHGRLFAEIDDRDKLSPVYGEGYVLLDVSVKVRWRGPREYGRRLNADYVPCLVDGVRS